MKCHDISISSLAYDMNPSFVAVKVRLVIQFSVMIIHIPACSGSLYSKTVKVH